MRLRGAGLTLETSFANQEQTSSNTDGINARNVGIPDEPPAGLTCDIHCDNYINSTWRRSNPLSFLSSKAFNSAYTFLKFKASYYTPQVLQSKPYITLIFFFAYKYRPFIYLLHDFIMGHSNSKPVDVSFSAQNAQRGIPRRFVASFSKSMTKMIINLNEPDSKEALYTIHLKYGAWGDMVLFNGPNPEDGPLVHVKPTGSWHKDCAVALPAIGNEPAREEIVRWESGWKHQTFWFALQVGQGANRSVERFEWRQSRGSEVKSLGRSSQGWKLVRLGTYDAKQVVQNEGEGRSSSDREEGFSSDGKEVVAVWANQKLMTRHMLTLGEFEFRGSGATGELGQAWALMALMSMMCAWQKEYQTTTAASAAAAGA